MESSVNVAAACALPMGEGAATLLLLDGVEGAAAVVLDVADVAEAEARGFGFVDLANSSLTLEAGETELEEGVVADPVRVGPVWRPLFLASEAVEGWVDLVAAAALTAASRATSCAAAQAAAS
jgi:hypothetical protein